VVKAPPPLIGAVSHVDCTCHPLAAVAAALMHADPAVAVVFMTCCPLLSRVLKPGGVAYMSFSNRCFPTKGELIVFASHPCRGLVEVEEQGLECCLWGSGVVCGQATCDIRLGHAGAPSITAMASIVQLVGLKCQGDTCLRPCLDQQYIALCLAEVYFLAEEVVTSGYFHCKAVLSTMNSPDQSLCPTTQPPKVPLPLLPLRFVSAPSHSHCAVDSHR
jgi:hypothetical protein